MRVEVTKDKGVMCRQTMSETENPLIGTADCQDRGNLDLQASFVA